MPQTAVANAYAAECIELCRTWQLSPGGVPPGPPRGGRTPGTPGSVLILGTSILARIATNGDKIDTQTVNGTLRAQFLNINQFCEPGCPGAPPDCKSAVFFD